MYHFFCYLLGVFLLPFQDLLYIARATEFFGVTHTRTIFMRAIESLPEKYVKDMCLKFADMERKLGEIDRARAVSYSTLILNSTVTFTDICSRCSILRSAYRASVLANLV